MSRVEAFRDTNLRSLLRELRTDIAMAVDDPFPLVYGLVDKKIITDQLLKVRKEIWKSEFRLEMSALFTCFSILITSICNLSNHKTLEIC